MDTAQGNVFQRIEKKYMLDGGKHQELMSRLQPFIVQDKYAAYSIYNIYFDTPNYDLIRSSVEKPDYKEKFRLRSYGIPKPDDKVYLEIKKKWSGIVSKRRVSMTYREAEAYLDFGFKPQSNSQIMNEIDYFIRFHRPERKLFLAYDRVAFSGKADPDVRITFDCNIRSRLNDLDLVKGDYGEPLLDTQSCLMEIKVPASLPLWLAKLLSELEIYPVSFSKYGAIYLKNIAARSPLGLYTPAYGDLNEEGELCLQTYSMPQRAV